MHAFCYHVMIESFQGSLDRFALCTHGGGGVGGGEIDEFYALVQFVVLSLFCKT